MPVPVKIDLLGVSVSRRHGAFLSDLWLVKNEQVTQTNRKIEGTLVFFNATMTQGRK